MKYLKSGKFLKCQVYGYDMLNIKPLEMWVLFSVYSLIIGRSIMLSNSCWKNKWMDCYIPIKAAWQSRYDTHPQ